VCESETWHRIAARQITLLAKLIESRTRTDASSMLVAEFRTAMIIAWSAVKSNSRISFEISQQPTRKETATASVMNNWSASVHTSNLATFLPMPCEKVPSP
jgi:hypothetical protein